MHQFFKKVVWRKENVMIRTKTSPHFMFRPKIVVVRSIGGKSRMPNSAET